MQIKMYPIADLVPDSANARKHGERNMEAITDSLREFGQYKPIVIQKSTRRILAGNARYEALKKLGVQDIACVEADVDNITATRIALTDNRTAELAEWDFNALSALFNRIDDAPLPGWSMEEITALCSSEMIQEDGQDGTSGASPWDRMGSGGSGVQFTCGEISATISHDVYNRFLEGVPETKVKEYIEGLLSR